MTIYSITPINPAENCTNCALSAGRQSVVWGEGPQTSRIMLIGEAPGAYEDASGRPFVGKSGNHLNDLIMRAGLDRRSLYVTNAVKCRPPGNRKPKPREAESCLDWLEYEMAVVDPSVVVLLGATSTRLAFPHEAKLGRLAAPPTARACTIAGKDTIAIASYHPAASCRDQDGKGRLADNIVAALVRAKRTVQEITSHE